MSRPVTSIEALPQTEDVTTTIIMGFKDQLTRRIEFHNAVQDEKALCEDWLAMEILDTCIIKQDDGRWHALQKPALKTWDFVYEFLHMVDKNELMPNGLCVTQNAQLVLRELESL